MSDLQQREYYRIFTGTNQEGGYDKIHLGYEAETSEIVFNPDKSTYFHIPFFASIQTIQNSTLISDGAVAGPIPALSDRIYKKLGGYGNSTPWGNTVDQKDGTWLCSWLYALSSEPPKWLDRYYHPGRLAYEEALEGNANFEDYYKNDPIYYDIPSVMTFEPGVQYQYFHQGENTIKNILSTFSGEDQSRLRLNVEDWSCFCEDNPHPIDKSIYNNEIVIEKFNEDWIVSLLDPGYQDRNSLSFNNTDFINCKIPYNDSYNLKDEFTTSFWVNHEDWSNATSTQLVGNLRKGGYGVFYNNLYSNPFFVIPENYYGHLFYCNQEGSVYLDKNAQFTLGTPSNPAVVAINSFSEVISLDSINKRLTKYNHVGDVLAVNKTGIGANFYLEGDVKNLILGGEDNCFVSTTSAFYTFDKDLLLISQDNNSPYIDNEKMAFDIEGNLVRELSCLDIKFDNFNQKWVIKEDKKVYCDDVLQINLTSNNTNLAVDPEGNIWILSGSDKIYKVNPENKEIIDTYEVGVSTASEDTKNIGFVKIYDRSFNKHTWYAIIYHNYEKNLYFVTLDGKIKENIYLPEKLNIYEPATALQDSEVLQFTGTGDFTGYEQKRIFNKVLFDNNPQIEFKVSIKSPNINLPDFVYKLSVPVPYFINKTWYLITVSIKNRTLSLYINNYLRDTLEIPGNRDLNFDYKNDFHVGSPSGKLDNYNKEILSKSVIWNGYLDSLKIYDYAIEPKFIPYFVREKLKPIDIIWNIPTAPLPYVEIIDRFFKHKFPGAKSSFFNVRIKGSEITDTTTREQIENDIKNAIEQIKPAYTDLLNVEWID